MYGTNLILSYSMGVFIVVLISGCILNLLKKHYVFQLTGIAFFFTYSIIKFSLALQTGIDIQPREVYFDILPVLAGLSACLISMVLGFWVFPPIRRKFKG